MSKSDARWGFQLGGRPRDLFTGTADYYATYRRPCPQPVVDYLVKRCGLDGQGQLFDGGCGTGQVFQTMARHFNKVLAIDPDPEMVARARRTAADFGLANVTVRQMRAEDLPADVGPLRMAIFAASFHWIDRPRVGELIYDLLEPNGSLAVLSPSGLHSGSTPWELAIREALKRHLGSERRAGGGVYCEGERHEQALKRTRFKNMEIVNIPVCERWSIDQIVGFLYSTSYASKAVLGDRAAAFEQDVRRSLRRLLPEGQAEKLVEYTVILAER